METKKMITIGIIIALLISTGSGLINKHHLNTELDSIPCWNEVCCEKEVTSDWALTVITHCKFKTERTSSMVITLKTRNLLTMRQYNEIMNPTLNELMESGSFGETVVYTTSIILDTDNTLIWDGKQGIKPDWLE